MLPRYHRAYLMSEADDMLLSDASDVVLMSAASDARRLPHVTFMR